MKSKSKIIVTVISMVMVFAVMCVGIWAASKVKIESDGGQILFTADNVFATVHVEQNGTDLTGGGLIFDATTDPTQPATGDGVTYLDPDKIPLDTVNILATNAGEVIDKINITVRNDLETGGNNLITKLTSVLTDLETEYADILTLTITGENGTAQTEVTREALEAGVEVAPQETLTITIEITLASNFNFQKSISTSYNFALDLALAE